MDIGIISQDERSAAFFDAAALGTLLIKRCRACGTWLGPEAGGCPDCGATGDDGPGWVPASGRGTLISWAVVYPRPASAGEALPTVLALVEVDEGDGVGEGGNELLKEHRQGGVDVVEFAH